ncbi:recombinase family protein [Mycobacterium yunnanensis]|uniref:Recombinase family protein n=1 Tax=Mycobacterium yunnanensis TaxID=368477 RepID=A0A9X2Z7N3_9MYCO|nr:recombinase family protein [Mycobacterium yunnanensis]MCV7423002.1 recombinase family protein [Mycobacterium yunnanensis]
MDAVIYTRVSSDQNGGRSVADQEKECRAVCERNGWPVRKVFVDNDRGASRYSAKGRPAWEALKTELRAGDVLVCWEASRTQRDLEEYVRLRNLCSALSVPLHYSGKLLDLNSGDDRFVGGLDALLAEREAELIRTRVLRGKLSAATDGRPSGKPVWGYRRADVAVWEIDPVEGPKVRTAVERMLAGESQRSVLSWLKSMEGYAPRDGTSLRRALSNPALAGLRVHQGAIAGKAAWEPIITEQQHKRLLARLDKQVKLTGWSSPPGPEPKHLLSGIAVCGTCATRLQWKRREGRPDAYRCPQGHVQRAAGPLDGRVAQAMRTILNALAGPVSALYGGESDEGGVPEIDALEAQLAEWEAAAIAGTVTPAAFSRIEAGLRARIAELAPTPKVADEAELGALAATGWDLSSTGDRRLGVRKLLTVTVHPAPAGRRPIDEDTVIVPSGWLAARIAT